MALVKVLFIIGAVVVSIAGLRTREPLTIVGAVLVDIAVALQYLK